MEKINEQTLDTLVSGVVVRKSCTIKADKDSTTVKNIHLEVSVDNVSVGSILHKAIAQTVIQWQNGPGRGKFDQWKDGQVVKILFTAPAVKAQLTPVQVLVQMGLPVEMAKMLAANPEMLKDALGKLGQTEPEVVMEEQVDNKQRDKNVSRHLGTKVSSKT